MSPLVRPNSGGNIKAGCRRLGVPDATARPWSTWIKSHSPPVGRYVQVLPMPTDEHQTMVLLLYELLVAFVRPRGGKVLVAPLRLKIRDGKYREPDIVLVRSARDPRRQNRFWLGADLVVEVVSPDKPERDLIEKRGEYAEAQIPEYWIVNPQSETITVLCLEGPAYIEHGVFGRSATATSVGLEGLSISVEAVFDAE